MITHCKCISYLVKNLQSNNNQSANLKTFQAMTATKTFVRIFDIQGKQIAKGHIHSITNTKIEIQRSKKTEKEALSDIKIIKSKRATAGTLLKSAQYYRNSGELDKSTNELLKLIIEYPTSKEGKEGKDLLNSTESSATISELVDKVLEIIKEKKER